MCDAHPVQLARAYDSAYTRQGWRTSLAEIKMPQKALSDNWMLWYRPAGEVISVTVLFIVPKEVEATAEEEPDSEASQPPAEHIILGRWILPAQDRDRD